MAELVANMSSWATQSPRSVSVGIRSKDQELKIFNGGRYVGWSPGEGAPKWSLFSRDFVGVLVKRPLIRHGPVVRLYVYTSIDTRARLHASTLWRFADTRSRSPAMQIPQRRL